MKNASLIQYEDFVPIYPYLISAGDEIVPACDHAQKRNRDSQETCY